MGESTTSSRGPQTSCSCCCFRINMVLLLLLLLQLQNPEAAPPSETDSGLNFLVAIPENIAYYHPMRAENRLNLVALYSNTKVLVWSHPPKNSNLVLQAGELREVDVSSDEIVRINSSKRIVVQLVVLKASSIQSVLVPPMDGPGSYYLVPPFWAAGGNWSSTSRRPFSIVVVNTGQKNKVTLEGERTSEADLDPEQMFRVPSWNGSFWVVRTEHPAAVLLGHVCAATSGCSCRMIFALLPPATGEALRFLVPPALVEAHEKDSFILVPDQENPRAEPFSTDSSVVEGGGSAFLYWPGMLLALIPEEHFSSCYIVTSIPGVEKHAVVLVQKNLANGVRVGRSLPEDPRWEELRGTSYVSGVLDLDQEKNVIWHRSANMAVYFLGNRSGVMFGNPAPSISRTPDHRGCVLREEVLEVGPVALSWPKSVQRCRETGLRLLSAPTADLQNHIHKLLRARGDREDQVWIGLRRSAMNGAWYWVSGEPYAASNWEAGQPGGVHGGPCVSMRLDGNEFGWRKRDCCQKLRPLCYRGPLLLPL